MEKKLSILISLDNDNLKLQKEIEAHLAELRIVLRSNIDVRQGYGFSNYSIDKYTKEDLEKSQVRKCFKGIVSSLHDYMDRLISIYELADNPLRVTRDLKSDEEKINYISEKRDDFLKKVSSDVGFTIPKKLKYLFPEDVKCDIRLYVQNYFDLRHAMEHKKSIPQKDITLKYFSKPKVFIEKTEINKEHKVEAGQQLEVIIVDVSKLFKKDEEIILSTEEIEEIGFTVMIQIVNFFVTSFNEKFNSKPS